jgi:hypothetical protein
MSEDLIREDEEKEEQMKIWICRNVSGINEKIARNSENESFINM